MIDGFRLIGQAITDFINSKSFSINFTTDRRNQLYWQSEQRAEPTGYVAPINVSMEPHTRGSRIDVYLFGFYLVQRFSEIAMIDQIDSQDVLMKVVDEVKDEIDRAQRIEGYLVTTVSADPRLPMVPEPMLEQQVFVGALPLTVTTEAC